MAEEESRVYKASEVHKRRAGDSQALREPQEPQEPQATRRAVQEPQRKRRWGLRIVGTLLALVVASALVFAGYFVADRWLVYDDHLSMQGEWHANGSDASVIITEDALVLSSDTEYEYTIDPIAKTISYQYGELQGEGRYWFSGDRNQLVIVDGSGNTALSTLFDDLVRTIGDFLDKTFGDAADLPSGDGVIVLSR